MNLSNVLLRRRAILILTCLVCLGFYASVSMTPDYSSTRKWIEAKNATSTVPKGKRVFVCSMGPKEYATIFSHRKAMNLKDVVEQTPFKSATNSVACVFRPDEQKRSRWFKVRWKDYGTEPVQAQDVIWLFEHESTPLW